MDYMSMLWEKVVFIAKRFIESENINDSREFREIITRTKQVQFNWDPGISAASMVAELVWKEAIGRESMQRWQQLDRLFSPSAVATHANFRGCRDYKTGSLPEKGAIAIWRLGNSWKGDIAIVSDVSDDKVTFDIIQGSVMMGSTSEVFLNVQERKGKRTDLPMRSDKYNLLGFIYPPAREIA
jgi:hypothetical protein